MRKLLTRFEQQPDDYHRRVRAGFLTLAEAEPERWLVVDGTLPPERIARQIWARVGPLLGGGADLPPIPLSDEL